MLGSIVGLALGLLASSQATTRELQVGVPPGWVELPADQPALLQGHPTVQLALRPSADGKATISALSFDFDVLLRVENEAGDVLAEDDGGGEANARLVVDLRGKRGYRVLVASKSGVAGWFHIGCQPGVQPALPRAAQLEVGIAFHAGSAGTAMDRGDPAAAAGHLESQAAFLRESSRIEEAEAVWDSARTLWAEAKEPRREAGATLELGRFAAARGSAAQAEERFARALALYRGIPDASGEARVLLAIAAAHAAAGDLAEGAARYGESRTAALGAGDLECAAEALEGLARVRRASGDRKGEREAIEALGDLRHDQRDFERARASHEQARGIAVEIGDAAAESRAWSDLGEDWLAARERSHARECFEKALELARKGGGKLAEAEALCGLGRLAFRADEHRAALDLHEQQLVAAGADPVQVYRATYWIGRCHLELEDVARARACLESAVAKARAAKLRLEEAETLDQLSLLEQEAGRVEKSDDLRQRAIELRSGAKPELRAAFLDAERLYHFGEFAQAQAAFEGCLEFERTHRDPWCRMVALWRLGECLEKRGRYSEAIRCSAEMLEITRMLGCRRDESEALERLGMQCRAVGALDAALEHLEEALPIAREMHDALQELDCKNGIAAVRFDLGQHENELEAHKEVGEIAHKLRMRILEAAVENNIGLVHWRTGHFAESRVPFETALQQARELKAPERVAEFSGNLARVLRRLGERVRAEELATESLAGFEELQLVEPKMLLIPLEALAGLALDNGNVEAAREHLEHAAAVLEELRLEAQAAPEDVGVDPWQFCLPFDRLGQDLVRLLDLEGGSERAARLADGFRLADRTRARQLGSGIVEHRRGTRSKEALDLHAEWKKTLGAHQAVQSALSAAIRTNRPSEEVDRLRQEAEQRKSRAGELELALRVVSPRDAALDLPQGVDPAEVRRAVVTEGCALVEYAEGDGDLYAYVLTGTSLALVELGPRGDVDEAVQRYLGLLTRSTSGAAEIAKDGKELFQLLLAAPLAAAGEIERLLIVPTPSLAVLPFDALVVQARPDVRAFADLEFVIERYEVDYGPSASILVELAARGPRKISGRMLVLADPVYPSEARVVESAAPRPGPGTATPNSLLMGRRRGAEDQNFGRLPRTREEAFEIARRIVESDETDALAQLSHLQEKRGGTLHGRRIDVHLGADATAARLAGSLRGYELLHLAAHGYVDGLAPRNTGLALSGTGGGADPGFFTIADASRLDLDANLVVLSACETARGKVVAGEGVESLACSFLRAGARGVVASLWQVQDLAAEETMKAFYAGIRESSLPPAQSLHAAKLALRRGSGTRGISLGEAAGGNEGHPNAWAPFIYAGAAQ